MRWVAVAALVLAACKARAPALEVECVKHQDCAQVSMGPNCCDVCAPRVGNAASIAAFSGWCDAHPAAGCPNLDCAGETFTAMCEDGRCLLRPGVHPL